MQRARVALLLVGFFPAILVEETRLLVADLLHVERLIQLDVTARLDLAQHVIRQQRLFAAHDATESRAEQQPSNEGEAGEQDAEIHAGSVAFPLNQLLSASRWQERHNRAHGTRSSRSISMSAPQRSQRPNCSGSL